MAKDFKVWIEIEEHDSETGEFTNRDDLIYVIPYIPGGMTEEQALTLADKLAEIGNQLRAQIVTKA